MPSQPPPQRAPAEVAAIFRLACWFGLATGIVEVVGRWVLWRFFDKYFVSMTHPHAAWMALVSDFLLFAAIGLVLAAAAWRMPRRVPLWLVGAVYAAVFYFCLGDIVAVKQWTAAASLVIGLAAFGARSAPRLLALARYTLWPLAGAAAILGGVFYGWAAWSEHRALAALPSAAAGAPNVLFITLDTVRADHLSFYHYPRPTTPRLEEYAKRGVVFDQAISTVSWTLPSHASMFTGHFPKDAFPELPTITTQSADDNRPTPAGASSATMTVDTNRPMNSRLPTLAEYFDGHGYRTAGFAANYTYCDRVFGLGRGFTHYVEYQLSVQQMLKSAYLTRILTTQLERRLHPRFDLARIDGLTINSEFLRWLDGVKDRPFFAFLNYMESHDPYDPPPPFAGRFSSGIGKVAALRDDYDCCLAALDHYVGRLLDELDRRGVLEHTLVVIVGDHGEHLGEHNHFRHGDTLYMPVIHVPLFVLYPGRVPAGVRVRGPVSLRDLAATIVDVLGMAGDSPFPGRSLRGRWDARHEPSRPAFSYLEATKRNARTKALVLAPLCSIVDERYHYLEWTGFNYRELYDLQHDPGETQDLFDAPGEEPILKRYHDKLEHGPD